MPAASYIAGGAGFHVVDLDGARTGVPHAAALRRAGSSAWPAKPVSTWSSGGGIRSEDDAEEVLDSGVAPRGARHRAALEEPALAGRSARRWPGRVAVGLDYRVGADGVAEAQAQGWLAGTGQSVTDLLELWQHDPVGAVVATSVARDGMPVGPTWPGCRRCWKPRRCRSWPRRASPTWGTWVPCRPCSKPGGRRLSGAIVGKAIVEGRFSVEEGIAVCAASD